MLVYHYSKKHIDEIVKSNVIWLNRLDSCKGQEEFCLDFEQYILILKQINLEDINFNKKFPREFFNIFLNQIDSFNGIEKFDKSKIYGACFTYNEPNKKFISKYGREYIEIDLDTIKRDSLNYLFIHKVNYDQGKNSQFIYDVLYQIYLKREYSLRYALELTEDQLPIDYNGLYNRLFYHLKFLMKKENFSFENEIRIILDKTILEGKIIERTESKTYYFAEVLNESNFNRHFEKRDDHYEMKLNSYNIKGLVKKINHSFD